jgi:predicted XRE-type DNA-binding protein
MKVRKSHENIFAELGFDRPEEEAAKVDLAYEIFTILKSRKLTQTKAATLLGISQADVSKLMNVRPHGFSLDWLFAILTRLERDVEIRVTKSSARRAGASESGAGRLASVPLPERRRPCSPKQVFGTR